MEGILALILIPLVIFLLFVAPLWLLLSYRSKKLAGQSLSDDELLQLDQLAQHAEKLAERVRVLEKLLDAETPHWREKL